LRGIPLEEVEEVIRKGTKWGEDNMKKGAGCPGCKSLLHVGENVVRWKGRLLAPRGNLGVAD